MDAVTTRPTTERAPADAAAVLRQAARQVFTGRLDLEADGGAVASVWLQGGAVVAVTASGSRPRLGVRLLSAGLVRPEDLDRALREQQGEAASLPLGDILVRDGAVERSEIEAVAHTQLVDEIADVLGWTIRGSALAADDRAPVALRAPVPVADLLTEAAARRGVWAELVRGLGGPDGVPRPSMLAAPRANLILGPYDWAVLTKADGLRTLTDLAEHCGMSIYETAAVVDALARMGLLVVGPARRRPAASPTAATPPPPSSPPAEAPATAEPKRPAAVDAAALLRELSALNRSSRPE